MIPALAPIFVGDFASRGDSVSLATNSLTAGSVFMPDLMSGDGIGKCLARFHTQYPLASPRALASLWMHTYCMTLLPTAVIASLLLDHDLPLEFGNVRVVIADDGTVAQLLLSNGGGTDTFGDQFSRFDAVLSHLSPLIEAIAVSSKVSRAILWGRVSSTLVWLEEVSRAHPLCSSDTGCQELLALLSTPAFPDGRRNPLYRKPTADGCVSQKPKQTCCFSHELGPEIARCWNCPVEQKKRRSAVSAQRPG